MKEGLLLKMHIQHKDTQIRKNQVNTTLPTNETPVTKPKEMEFHRLPGKGSNVIILKKINHTEECTDKYNQENKCMNKIRSLTKKETKEPNRNPEKYNN